jgi:DNA-binding NarL/FixJ family response regulator
VNPKKIEVFLVDDHVVLRECLAGYIDAQEDMKVVGMAGTPEETMKTLASQHPDVMVLDVSLGERSGFEILESLGVMKSPPRVLILTMHRNQELIRKCMENGARGFVLKHDPTGILLEGIRQLYKGKSYMSAEATQVLFSDNDRSGGPEDPPLNTLTPREVEILDLLGNGMRL